jgi:hypothetical protein
MGDLLKITDKVGVSSTRHVGEDYLSKLQNSYKPSAKDVFVYKPAPSDINSPKYGQTAILSEIINMNNLQRELTS